MAYYVYKLLDDKGLVFYVGFTKNLKIRIYEHSLLQGKNKAKDRKIEKAINKFGHLPYSYIEVGTVEEAAVEEKRLIKKYKPQLTNKHIGGNYVRDFVRPKRKPNVKRRTKCKTCGKLFININRHKCKETNNG